MIIRPIVLINYSFLNRMSISVWKSNTKQELRDEIIKAYIFVFGIVHVTKSNQLYEYNIVPQRLKLYASI
jgi:hypothetical protein